MTHSNNLEPFDYYHPHKPSGCKPCPNPGLHAYPASPSDMAVAEHNKDPKAHPYLLQLIKDITCNYCSRDSISARDDIAEEDRTEGLMVYVIETDKVYRLEEGIENSNWKELNINSKQYIKLGRYNAPDKPEIGMMFFDLRAERLKVYMGEWVTLPNMLDINQMIQNHNADPNAHADRFAEVENIWLAI